MKDRVDDMPRDPEEVAAEDAAMEYVDAQFEMFEKEHQDRLWLRTCVVFMEAACKPNKPEVSGRIQLAMDRAVIAACERAARIFNSDLEPVGGVDDRA